MSYSLIVRPLAPARAAVLEVKSLGQNPSMQRTNTVDFDQGREWAGDYYTEGPVTDPEEAYAHFNGGEDTEAWLDKGDDGTLIGWVRVGNDIWRYSDPEAWALDVDGAGMSRTDPGVGAATGDPTATPEQDGEDLNLGADPGASGGDPTAEPEGLEEDLPDAPTGFANEDDPATTEADPTDPLEDPTNLDDEQSDDATNPFDGLTDEDVELDESAVPAEPEQDAEAQADPDEAAEPVEPGPDDEPAKEPAKEPGEEPGDGDEPPGEPEEPETEEEDEEELKKRLALQGKHLPGQHNQEEHGNWAHGPGRILPRARRAAEHSTGSTSGGGGAPEAPKAGEAAPAKKARLSPESVKALSTEDLAALMDSSDLYDLDTMMAAAQAYDDRDDPHDRIKAAAEHTAPGSPEEAAAFDSVIPPAWLWWAGRNATGKRPGGTRKDDVEDQWFHYWYSLMLRAERDLNGVFLKRGVTEAELAKRHIKVDDFFNARIARQRLRNLMSPELIDWLDQHAISRREWLAEFYPSYAKQLRELGSGEALGENG